MSSMLLLVLYVIKCLLFGSGDLFVPEGIDWPSRLLMFLQNMRASYFRHLYLLF